MGDARPMNPLRRLASPASTWTFALCLAAIFASAPRCLSQPPGTRNAPFAYYVCMEELAWLPGSQVSPGAKVSPLPDRLVIPPGTYEFAGGSYAMQREGLYRFVHYPEKTEQRIVYHENAQALLSGIAWIVAHGARDHGVPQEALKAKAMHEKLFLTCGPTAEFARQILAEHKIESRTVSGLTLDEWNTYDNGHTLLEVLDKKLRKWVLYDLDQSGYFTHAGQPLSLVEFAAQAVSGEYEIHPVALDTRLDAKDFSITFLLETTGVQSGLRTWYKRVMQVPLIGGYFYLALPDDAARKRVESYSSSYHYLAKEEFIKRFYP
ncbi:MAG: hypothetical protein HUU20_13845 [Pirellulales bacterium]|nr:hypothetical protein [Pirellulales bacterium]